MTLNHTRVAGRRKKGRLVAYEVALEAAAQVCRLSEKLPPALKSQQDQAVRAAARMPPEIAEGQGRDGRDAKHLYRVAYSSARETTAVIELLVALHAIDATAGDDALDRLDRVQALLWGLMRRVA